MIVCSMQLTVGWKGVGCFFCWIRVWIFQGVRIHRKIITSTTALLKYVRIDRILSYSGFRKSPYTSHAYLEEHDLCIINRDAEVIQTQNYHWSAYNPILNRMLTPSFLQSSVKVSKRRILTNERLGNGRQAKKSLPPTEQYPEHTKANITHTIHRPTLQNIHKPTTALTRDS